MTIHHLEKENSILNKFLSEIRDVNIQEDSQRFRRNIERIGEILGYELSKHLNYSSQKITTCLGTKSINLPNNKIVLCSVLRAGLPLHQGLLNYFDAAESAYISAYRSHSEDGAKSEIIVEYFAAPSLENKTLLLADPMLATGQSLIAVYDAIKKYGNTQEIHLVTVIASTEGIECIKNHFPENTHLWIAAIDDELNDKGYIVPGLGDAGDLAFGSKL